MLDQRLHGQDLAGTKFCDTLVCRTNHANLRCPAYATRRSVEYSQQNDWTYIFLEVSLRKKKQIYTFQLNQISKNFRYPRLFDFISTQLRLATAAIAAHERPLNLHPLLLLLSRLYPSSLEGCESSLQLASFLPHIMLCSVCPEMETRKLAVKSMFALIAPNKVDSHIQDVLRLIHVS